MWSISDFSKFLETDQRCDFEAHCKYVQCLLCLRGQQVWVSRFLVRTLGSTEHKFLKVLSITCWFVDDQWELFALQLRNYCLVNCRSDVFGYDSLYTLTADLSVLNKKSKKLGKLFTCSEWNVFYGTEACQISVKLSPGWLLFVWKEERWLMWLVWTNINKGDWITFYGFQYALNGSNLCHLNVFCAWIAFFVLLKAFAGFFILDLFHKIFNYIL